MSLRERIRRIRGIEEKLFPALKLDGEKLPVPILIVEYVSARPDGTGLAEMQHATVEGKKYDREPGETVEDFKSRMKSLLPDSLQPGKFAYLISFTPGV
jgi:hypothetical protein